MRTVLRSCALAAPLLLGTTIASATSHHEQVTITPIKNKAGKTTGATVYALLQSSGHGFARIGLLPSRADMPPGAMGLKQDIMKANSTRWLYLHPEVDMQPAGAAEVTMTIDYKKTGIKAGEKYQLGSTWFDASKQDGQHLWGVEWQRNWGDPEIEMPK